jgi:hypothetical protein
MNELSVATEFEQTGTYLWPVTSGNVYAREFLEQVCRRHLQWELTVS